MQLNSRPIDTRRWRNLLYRGIAAGFAGGVAEIVGVSLYSAGASGGALGVARAVAAAVGLDATSAWTGITVHLALSILLGVALTCAWKLVSGKTERIVPLYAFMLVALAAVWGINFFLVLPVLSPGFATLLPYTITLTSKLMFGCAAATTLYVCSGAAETRAGARFLPALARA